MAPSTQSLAKDMDQNNIPVVLQELNRRQRRNFDLYLRCLRLLLFNNKLRKWFRTSSQDMLDEHVDRNGAIRKAS